MSSCHKIVAEKTSNEIQHFVAELLFGTSNYKSLHNLNEQMVHDYANRFLIELMQNSHDALEYPSENGEPSGKVKIVLNEKAGDTSTLYVANNGNPFSKSNFDALSCFGQSDKDPQSSIGNKGIGFRSVLQICSNPQIFSGPWNIDTGFSGYCFKFDPESKKSLLDQIIMSLVNHEKIKINMFNVEMELFDGIPSKEKRMQKNLLPKCKEKGISLEKYIQDEYEYLSPYLLPIPINGATSDEILWALGNDGYVTVVKLDITGAEALQSAKDAIKELSNRSAIIFLNRLRELTVEHYGNTEENLGVCLIRSTKEIALFDETVTNKIIVTDNFTESEDEWWTWSKKFDHNCPSILTGIREAVSELPGNWKELNQVKIEIAVNVSDRPNPGLIYIFLPTRQNNGFYYHLNAPFFGEINRKSINLEKRYNRILLDLTAELVYSAVTYLKEAKPDGCENMIADLVCLKNNEAELEKIIMTGLEKKLQKISLALKNWDIIPYHDRSDVIKFGTLSNVYALPLNWNYKFFSKENLVTYVNKKIISGITTNRLEIIKTLSEYVGMNMEPIESDLVDWVESIAQYLLDNKAAKDQWNEFYSEMILLVKNPESLMGKRVLLGDDDILHAGGGQDGTYIFLNPVQSSEDPEKENNTEATSKLDVPSFLRDRMSFLNSEIVLSEEKSNRRNDLHYYLAERSNSLVERFRVESIMDKIILPQMVGDVVKYSNPKSKELWEIFFWSMELYHNASRELESIQKRFGKIMVPCKGGWYPAGQAYFSADWDGLGKIRNASLLSEFFNDEKAGKDFATLNKQLIPRRSTRWQKNLKHPYRFDKIAEFLLFCGVSDSLRLVPVNKKGVISVSGNNKSFYFAQKPDFLLTDDEFEHFKSYLHQVRGVYINYFRYEIRDLLIIEGYLGRYHILSLEGKVNFAMLLVRSISKWQNSWHTCKIHKITGEHWVKQIDSLLKILLKETAWIPVGKKDAGIFSQPHKCWYVPATDLRPYNYAFIPYVESGTAKVIEDEQESFERLLLIGLSPFKFQTTKDGFKLLVELAESYAREDVASEQMNFFIGHYRYAWEMIEEIYSNNGYDNDIIPPEKLVVTRGRGVMDVVSASADELDDYTIYIPDDKELYNRLKGNSAISMLMIEPGRKYVKLLGEIFGDRLEPLSNLTQEIIIDDQKWSHEDSKNVECFLITEIGEWFLDFVSCVATCRENSNISIGKRRFKEIVSLLRRAKYKPCFSIETVLTTRDGKRLNVNDEVAILHKELETFFVQNNRDLSYERLAKPVSEYLGITDLTVPLAFSLSKLKEHFGGDEPEEASLMAALSVLHITPDNYDEVKKNIRDTLEWSIERLYPVMAVFNKNVELTETEISSIMSEEMLRQYLSQHIPDNISVDYLLQISQKLTNDLEMGRKLYEDIQLTLAQWNDALEKIGRRKILNQEIGEEFTLFKNQFKNGIMAVLREKVKLSNDTNSYIKDKDSFERLNCPPDWDELYWDVEPKPALSLIAEWLKNLKTSPQIIIDCFLKYDKATDVLSCFEGCCPDASLSPEEVRKNNHWLWLDVAGKIHRALIAGLNSKKITIPGNLQGSSESFIQKALEGKEIEMEIRLWNEKQIIEAFADFQDFKEAAALMEISLTKIDSCHDLILELGISENDLVYAKDILRKNQEQEIKKRRTVLIKGEEFDTDETNLGDLWNVLRKQIGFNVGMKGSLTAPLKLAPQKQKKKGVATASHTRGRPPKLNKNIENAVGLAGELMVFEALRREYIDSFTDDCWKSVNSTIYFPGKEANDSLGYDFAFVYNKKKYLIEVKATTGNEYQFEMGSSETRAALENTKRSRYMVAFIPRIFEDPKIFWLPNPFSQEGQKSYYIREAGSRISFKL